jgi:hypothetical protein
MRPELVPEEGSDRTFAGVKEAEPAPVRVAR